MVKKDAIRLQAKVTDALPNAVFKVELENGHKTVFYPSELTPLSKPARA